MPENNLVIKADDIIAGKRNVAEIIETAVERSSAVFVSEAIHFNHDVSTRLLFHTLREGAQHAGVPVVFDIPAEELEFIMTAPKEHRLAFELNAQDVLDNKINVKRIIQIIRDRGMKLFVKNMDAFRQAGEKGVDAFCLIKELAAKYRVYLETDEKIKGINEESKPFIVDAQEILMKVINVERMIEVARDEGRTILIKNSALFGENPQYMNIRLNVLKLAFDAGVIVRTKET